MRVILKVYFSLLVSGYHVRSLEIATLSKQQKAEQIESSTTILGTVRGKDSG